MKRSNTTALETGIWALVIDRPGSGSVGGDLQFGAVEAGRWQEGHIGILAVPWQFICVDTGAGKSMGKCPSWMFPSPSCSLGVGCSLLL